MRLLELNSGLHKKCQWMEEQVKMTLQRTATPIKTKGLFLKITRFLH